MIHGQIDRQAHIDVTHRQIEKRTDRLIQTQAERQTHLEDRKTQRQIVSDLVTQSIEQSM